MIKFPLIKLINNFIILVGIGILLLNCFGLIITKRVPNLQNQEIMRFNDDITLSLPQFKKELKIKSSENSLDYAKRATKVIADGLAHVDIRDKDSLDCYFRIKLWDNWILNLVSHIPFLPEKEWREYHYMNLSRTIERGVGYCGDAALLIAYLLEKRGLKTRIAAFPLHVITEIHFPETGDTLFVDADFGVWAHGSIKSIISDLNNIEKIYSKAGFPSQDIEILKDIYSENEIYYNGYKAFSPKKYYLENTLYILKWLIPILMIILPLLGIPRLSLTWTSHK